MNLPLGAISNGLAAEDWVPACTAPLPLAQHLLVALRSETIPAYAVAEVDESAFRALSTRSPLDHTIYVNRSDRSRAKALMLSESRELEGQGLSVDDGEIDSEFARLVESFETTQSTVEEHFSPPSPPLEISADPLTRAAWIALIGGPVVLLLNVWGLLTLDGLGPLVGVAAFIFGFVSLVVRMPHRLPLDEGPDDGAVV